MNLKPILVSLLLIGCIDAENDSGADSGAAECEILEDVSCWDDENQTEIECPEGYTCSGLSAHFCYAGECDNLPVCLPGNTRISTPTGTVAISDLQVGMTVWSVNEKGETVPALVEKAEHVWAPAHHKVIDLTLEDGRRFRASPDHPDVDGKALISHQIGDVLDGAKITGKTLVSHGGARTWDILPSGPTGIYLANGVWLGSTLKADEQPAGLAKRSLKTQPHR
jgi:hypothetical protein